MSKTDSTRPYDVQEKDPRTRWIRRHGKPVPIVGGLSGANGHAKKERRLVNGQTRQRDNEVARKAKYNGDADVPPIRADRRSIG